MKALLVKLRLEHERRHGLGEALIEDEIAQTVRDENSPVDLESLEDVGVMANDDAGARLHRLPAKLPLR